MAFVMVGLKRSKTGRWAARKEIPADVRTAYGKREEKKSWPAELTAGQAKAELASWLFPIEERIAALRSSQTQVLLTLSQRQTIALAGEWYRAKVAHYEENPGTVEGWIASAEEVQLVSLDPDGDPNGPVVFRVAADSFLVAERGALLFEKGLSLARASAEALLQEMCRLWLQLCALMERRAQVEYGPTRSPSRPCRAQPYCRARAFG